MPPRKKTASVNESTKNIIYHLYIVEDYTLKRVQSTMKEKHLFVRTENEYQNLFRNWGFVKKHTSDVWKILKRKTENRGAVQKKSAIYFNSKRLLDKDVKKEYGRPSVFMDALESFLDNQTPMPATPPGFMICTPGEQRLSHHVLSKLPILSFMGSLAKSKGFAESAIQFDPNFMSLTPFFTASATHVTRTEFNGKSSASHMKDADLQHCVDTLAAILPTSTFANEGVATGLGLDRIGRLGSTEFLNLTTYMLSNNFPGNANSKEIYSWLKARGSANILRVFASVDDITTKALLEGIFRLAVEAGDTLTVKELLRLKVNPNGHQVMLKKLVDTLNTLQHACLTGNTKLAQALIDAGAIVEEDKHGWKRSIIALAIVGEFRGLTEFDDIFLDFLYEDEADSEAEIYGDGAPMDCGFETAHYSDYKHHRIQHNEIEFVHLIDSLVGAGSKVIFGDVDVGSEQSWDDDDWSEYDDCTPKAFKGCDTPLAAAAKYKQPHLVEKILGLGAAAHFQSISGTFPIQECLLSLEETLIILDHSDSPKYTRDYIRARSSLAVYGFKNISKIVQSLLQAHAHPNSNYGRGNCQHGLLGCNGTALLEIAIIGGFEDLVRELLTLGATTNEMCLEYAVCVGNRAILEYILDTGVCLTPRAVRAAGEEHQHILYSALLSRQRNPEFKAYAIIVAIQFGITDDLPDLRSVDLAVLHKHTLLLREAIKECCSMENTGVFRKLLKTRTPIRSTLLPMIPSALARLMRADTCDLELCDALLDIIEIDATLIAACSRTLFAAIERHQDTIAIRLIRAGVPLNENRSDCSVPYHYGSTLVAAIFERRQAVVYELFNANVDVNARVLMQDDSQEQKAPLSCMSPLSAAVWRYHTRCDTRDWKFGRGLCDKYSASTCCSVDMHLVQELLRRGANPFDEEAIKSSRSDVIVSQILLDLVVENANQYLHIKTGIWHVVFESAISQNNLGLALMLLQRHLLDPNLIWDNRAPLSIAIRLDRGPDYKFIDMLLRHGADLNRDVSMDACDSPQSPLMVATSYGDCQKVEYLLQCGAHVNMFENGDFQMSPLQYAIKEKSSAEMVMLLLEWQADPNLYAQYFGAPLQRAVYLGNFEIVTLLLEGGANPNGICPHHIGQQHSEILVEGYYTPLQVAVDRSHTTLVKLLLRYQADPNIVQHETVHTLLQMAVRNGNMEMTELLLAAGASACAPPCNNSGATALQFAAIGGYLGIAFLLLDYKVDVNTAGAPINGRTALEGAAEHGRIDMIKMLLNAGADVHGEGQIQYERAINFASSNGHHAAKQMLEEHHDG